MVRFFDIFFSSLALILLSPILILTSFMLRLTGEGEVLYKQKRIGQRGKEFYLIKFATMLKNSPNLGTGTITVKDDPRILPYGKLLRVTKINELPQLINVLNGDMSLIGPRPLTYDTFNAYDMSIQKTIKTVKPGLSGIGSIIFRDEERFITDQAQAVKIYEKEVAPFKGQLEVWYVKNCGLRTYLALIFFTIWVVITRDPKILWNFFRDLPQPNDYIRSRL